VDDHSHFQEVFKGSECPHWVQVRNILLFEDNSATHLQDRSCIHVKFVYDAFYEDQILLDAKNVFFSSYACVNNGPDMWHFQHG